MQMLIDRVFGLVDTMFGNIFDDTMKHVVNKIEYNKLLKDVKEVLRKYLQNPEYDNTIITTGEFWTYIEFNKIYQSLFLYVYQPQNNDIKEEEFLLKLSKDVLERCNRDAANNLYIALDFFKSILAICKDYIYKKSSENQAHIYEILQTKLGVKNVEKSVSDMNDRLLGPNTVNQTIYLTNQYNMTEEQILDIYYNTLRDISEKTKNELSDHAKNLAQSLIQNVININPDLIVKLAKPKSETLISSLVKTSFYSEKAYDEFLIKTLVDYIANNNDRDFFIILKMYELLANMTFEDIERFLKLRDYQPILCRSMELGNNDEEWEEEKKQSFHKLKKEVDAFKSEFDKNQRSLEYQISCYSLMRDIGLVIKYESKYSETKLLQKKEIYINNTDVSSLYNNIYGNNISRGYYKCIFITYLTDLEQKNIINIFNDFEIMNYYNDNEKVIYLKFLEHLIKKSDSRFKELVFHKDMMNKLIKEITIDKKIAKKIINDIELKKFFYGYMKLQGNILGDSIGSSEWAYNYFIQDNYKYTYTYLGSEIRNKILKYYYV